MVKGRTIGRDTYQWLSEVEREGRICLQMGSVRDLGYDEVFCFMTVEVNTRLHAFAKIHRTVYHKEYVLQYLIFFDPFQ